MRTGGAILFDHHLTKAKFSEASGQSIKFCSMALSTVVTVIIGFLLATTNAVTKKQKKASDPNDNKGTNVMTQTLVAN